MKRRDFLKGSVISGSALVLSSSSVEGRNTHFSFSAGETKSATTMAPALDLSPARWLWYPSERCLANSFVLFRRELQLPEKPVRARGWISADSRYRLEVNGERVQWGPAPFDPRWMEADPLDLTALLQAGSNVVGAIVLFYGLGDGTSPLGKPGFIFKLDLEYSSGRKETIGSDSTWKAHLAQAWKPGHYKRWYLRSLQEEFDSRLYPAGWSGQGYSPDPGWLPAMMLDCPAYLPPLCSNYPDYLYDSAGEKDQCRLRRRSIPALNEFWVPVKKLTESMWLTWSRPPEEYFDVRTPECFQVDRKSSVREIRPGEWELFFDGNKTAALTFELEEQIVGWPAFEIEAAEGTTIELLVQEAHQVGGPALLNSHFDSWTRFICRLGVNRFETFDFESCRWIQLHIHKTQGAVRIRKVGLRRRQFPWPQTPRIRCSEPTLQKLFDASVNTLHNSAQETIVDGMARERQQYSGDCGHQLHALYFGFGETRLPARYLSTYSQGITLDGYFLDSWPAYDRLARLMERQLQLTSWGPILDHGIGFNFDCCYHYLYTGDLRAIEEPFPRLLRFADYLQSILTAEGLLPVENLGIPSVWIDHQAYQRQRHKQCAFNLYAAAMLQRALAPICRAFGDSARANAALALGERILSSSIKAFWSPRHQIFINNLPWLAEEQSIRMCDRSLATAILFDQCPGEKSANALKTLVECPPEMGFSYPANAGWRLWALAAGGRADVIVQDLRERWATLDSIRLNNTLQEDWKVKADSSSQWSHCPVAPLFVTYMSLAGIRPLDPGFSRCEIRPQLADLPDLDLMAHTVKGPIEFHAKKDGRQHQLSISLPTGCAAELVVPQSSNIALPALQTAAPFSCRRYRMAAGSHVEFLLGR